ncbi:MAG TPA: response regulator [Labilithrix sp.]|nr:response regulator [Labilithrix sp.]
MKPIVLVVEDDGDLREIVCEVLENAGCEARPAASGEEALTVLGAAQHADLILLDLTMPGMSGFELRERLLRAPELCGIPVVVMTASRGFDASGLSPAGVLLKPLDVSQLLDMIDEVLPASAARSAE